MQLRPFRLPLPPLWGRMRAAGLHGEQHLAHSCCSSAHPLGRQLSSTPLEILLFLNGWYYATYFLLEIFIFIYKGEFPPLPFQPPFQITRASRCAVPSSAT